MGAPSPENASGSSPTGDPAGAPAGPILAAQPVLELVEVAVTSRGGPWDPTSLAVPPGTLVVHPLDDGSGSPELVLALAGRFRPVSGTVMHRGKPVTTAWLRRHVVVARVRDAIEPEPRLRVDEYMRSSHTLTAARAQGLQADECLAICGFALGQREMRIEDLGPADLVRVCVAGALQGRPAAVVVDRADRGLLDSQWQALAADLTLAASQAGVAIIATASRPAPTAPGNEERP